MRKSYQFYCNCCELNLILYKGIEEKYKKKTTNFYCFNCHKISYHDECVDCGDKLYYAVEVPKEKKYSVLEEENSIELKLQCMRCRSKDTTLVIIGEWNQGI
ncbi:MAG: hypothetical protein KAU62_16315 [Candidatus Heimdallarchaeota archaeon]|nr:hypothetical protein [Candidatus Heimdallarchaeota archaeon]MCK4612720.1 hypothetical protein [Candidatus Heimdallarchaeota archaeon]